MDPHLFTLLSGGWLMSQIRLASLPTLLNQYYETYQGATWRKNQFGK